MARTESGVMSPLLALLLGTALWPHVLCQFSYNKVIWKDPRNKFWYEGPPVDTFSLAMNNANFAFSLYKLLTAQNPGANVIFSPLSISSAMALLALGADKSTQTETLQGLKFNLTKTPADEIHRGFKLLLSLLGMSQGPMQLNVSNALFLDKKLWLSKSFQKEAQEMYGAETFSANFRDTTYAKRHINSYMRRKSRGKISELVKFLDPEGQMLLVNCLLFKDKWKMPFDPYNTVKSDFYLSQDRKTKVPMMRIQNIKVSYFLDKMYDCTVVQLPYMNNTVSALFILPNKNNMAKLEADLQLSMLRLWRNSVKMRQINLHLPKFSISRDYDLDEILPIMGITKVFSEKADFSRITNAKNLAISQVIHKAVLDVTEDGTEEAATKPDNYAPYSENLNLNTVKFNKPFLINLISEDTQNMIYLGKVTNPLKS